MNRIMLFIWLGLVSLMAENKLSPTQNWSAGPPLGCTVTSNAVTFRLFAPHAAWVRVVLYHQVTDTQGTEKSLQQNEDGVWELTLSRREFPWRYYAYRLDGPHTPFYDFNPQVTVGDPYAKAVARQNHYTYPTKCLIFPPQDFDWEGDQGVKLAPEDAVILEAHLRDMTAHPSSGSRQPGTYLGFAELHQKGGLAHILDMGYNAVEFLPLQEFANFEVPYRDSTAPVYNTWNPYAYNHWGYMTSFFFAPELYYASDGNRTPGAWLGADGRAVTELKTLIKTLHRHGIAVIMDVVYNHVSQYDQNPLKAIDKAYYFNLDSQGNYLSASGCGNDFNTAAPMARRLIVESLVYWAREYHVDGFRFDLAAMIDPGTRAAITQALKAVNPDILLIGEPWGGGGYNPAQLADEGWASWNDQIRNGIKGSYPSPDQLGLIFGRTWVNKPRGFYENLFRGFLRDQGGYYHSAAQSVNYLESHDDHTLGDFIRLGLGKVKADEVVNREQIARLSESELRLHRMAALCLFVTPGPIMVAQGQSWGRSKVIATGPKAGLIDHNSYEKDDETNWLNWREKDRNPELVNYYRGLINLRKQYPSLRYYEPGQREFFAGDQPLSMGILIKDEPQLLVLLNPSAENECQFSLPPGKWRWLVTPKEVLPAPGEIVSSRFSLPSRSGCLLIRE